MTFFSKILMRMDEILTQGDSDDLMGIRINAKGETVCYYCGEIPDFRGFNYEHLAPHSLGGPSRNWNMVLACFNCNQRKKAKTPPRWFLQEVDILSTLPDEIAIDLLARLLLNLHIFMTAKISSGIPTAMGLSEVGHIPRFVGGHQWEANVLVGASRTHADFECPTCQKPSKVTCSPGMYIIHVTCDECERYSVYQGFPLLRRQ